MHRAVCFVPQHLLALGLFYVLLTHRPRLQICEYYLAEVEKAGGRQEVRHKRSCRRAHRTLERLSLTPRYHLP